MSSRIEELLLTITIDTECDHDSRWTRAVPLSFESVTEGVPNRLQPAFESIGAVPTYLLTPEVLESDECIQSLQSIRGPYELGSHMHAAFVEPEAKFRTYAGIDSPDFQSSYPPEIEKAKLATLTNLFESRLGYRPTSFRAGRFGAGPNTIDSLQSLGYRVDTSVTPYLRWQEPNGFVDFRQAPEQPYHPAAGTIDLAGPATPGRLLEVPVTVRPKLMRRSPVWFRPWFATVDEMKNVVRYHLREHAERRVVVVNMMFHSMEVIEKASPYPQTSADVQRFLDDMQETLTWCSEEGARFMPLSALADRFDPYTGLG